LIYYFGEKNISRLNIIKSETNKLKINFCYDKIDVKIEYDRISMLVKEKIIRFDKDVVRFNITNDDPLLKIISSCLNYTADFNNNKLLNMATTKLFLSIKQQIKIIK
jgi:hypothetical protein